MADELDLGDEGVWDDPVVMLHDIDAFEIEREPINRTWTKFFPRFSPDHPDSYPYRTPQTTSSFGYRRATR